MKIFLQHNQTKSFFAAHDTWTTHPEAARLFANSQELWSFCAANRIEDVQMIVKFEDPRFDMTIPVVLANSTARRTILLVEDNSDDVLLILRAFKKTGINDSVQVVNDGVQAIAYLAGENNYSDRARFPLPRLIVMDIKMPRMNGLEVLQWMNAHTALRATPKIILSSSKLDADVTRAYDLGANTYFAKPSGFEELLLLVKSIHAYWLVDETRDPKTIALSSVTQPA